ncbi:MAG: DUF2085 domain-containing protein [Bacteroidetes bacterium]|nr:DUF2085 domain-containing protein [Bacteroidota bacterium]MCH8524286.1 DUF2085 domain-containing protein [Balneolales bacterium]
MLHWKSQWYWYAILVSTGVVLAALGPGLFSGNIGLSEWYTSWQKQLFSTVCHQELQRVMSIHEIPMAVCSRCLGIYTSFWAGLLMIPVLPQHRLRSKLIVPLIIFGVLLNIFDVVAYASGSWSNTLHSRLIAGIFMGLPAAVLLGTSQPQIRFKVT